MKWRGQVGVRIWPGPFLFGLWVVFVFWGSGLLVAIEEQRTWVDREGRELEALLISREAETIEVERKDGQRFQIPVSILSEEDQRYLEERSRPAPWREPPEGFRRIPGGTFQMGDHTRSLNHSLPVHAVTLGEFYLKEVPVTYAQWREVVDWATHPDRGEKRYQFANEGRAGGGRSGGDPGHPVTGVDWYDVLKWCNARSEMENREPVYYREAEHVRVYRRGREDLTPERVRWGANGYRIPTEAEWERAARGGLEDQRYSWGNGEVRPNRANFWNSNENNGTSPVRAYPPNGYGLYDMSGNVWEWTWNRWGSFSAEAVRDPLGPLSATHRVTRGGSWSNPASQLQVAYRRVTFPTNNYPRIGFRIAVSGEGDSEL